MTRKDQIKSMLEKEPTSSFLLFALAKEYENENNPALAIRTYLDLLNQNNQYTGAYYHLGKQYEAMGEIGAAVSIFTKGIEICKQVHAMHDASELKSALEELEEL